MFFTYRPYDMECWLKTSDSGKRSDTGSVSGNKFCDMQGRQ